MSPRRLQFTLLVALVLVLVLGIVMYVFAAYLPDIFIGAAGLALLVGGITFRRHHQLAKLPLKAHVLEAARQAHDQEMERQAQERETQWLAMERERHDYEQRRADEMHTLKLQLMSSHWQLEQHLALTRVLPDAKGHYPYIVSQDGQTYQHLPNPHMSVKQIAASAPEVTEEEDGGSVLLPSLVKYDDIRAQVPRGHTLLGIGTNGLETRPFQVLSTCWIVGGSKTGKCLHENEPVFLADGRVFPAKMLIGQSVEVIGVTDTQTMRQTPVLASFAENGLRVVIEIELDNGVVLRRTEEHPLWTAQLERYGGRRDVGKHEDGRRMREDNRRIRAIDAGWIQAKDIHPGEKRYSGQAILCPVKLQQMGTIRRSDEEVMLCAVLLAEGGLTGRGIRFTSASPEIVEAMTRSVAKYDCEVVPIPMSSKREVIDYRICKKTRGAGENKVSTLTKEWGIAGCSALDKAVPQWVFQLPDEQVALFLRLFIDCDGWFDAREKFQPTVNVTLANQVLVQQIGQLALRLGIKGSYRYKTNTCAGAWQWSSTRVDLWQTKVGSTIKADTLEKAVQARLSQQKSAKTVRGAWRTAQSSDTQAFADCPQGYEWRKVVAVRKSVAPTVSIQVHNDNHAFVGYAVEHNTNTVAGKVEEAYSMGCWFCVIDPHRYKDDSLFNSIKGYRDRFIAPGCATAPEDILAMLKAFWREAQARLSGESKKRTPIILLADEIGHICDTVGLEGEELALAQETVALFKKLSRMCGQELRGFNMFGWFISQTATGLAWLRKNAMTVIAHKVLMMSERKLACNEDMALARSMDTWPIGRIVVYGLDFPDGSMILQQPVFTPRIVDAEQFRQDPPDRNSVTDDETTTEAHLHNRRPLFRVSVSEDGPSTKTKGSGVSDETKNIIKRMHSSGMKMRDIAKLVGLAGEKYGMFQAACMELGLSPKKTEEA